jgi:hypothetical protein
VLCTCTDAAINLSGAEKFKFIYILSWLEVFSSFDQIQKYPQAKGTAFHQVLNQLGTLTDLISNWKMTSVPQPVMMFKTCTINRVWQ